jgi:UDP-3-O-[3-hydroxymyristoyl] glucosamine N-acyltransferase
MINTEIINKVLNKSITSNLLFDALDDICSVKPNTLTYCNSEKYLIQALNNPNVTGIICRKEICLDIETNKDIIESENPGFDFILLHNYYHSKNNNTNLEKSFIHPGAIIHPTANINELGVIIEDGVTVGPYVVIYPKVTIKKNTSIGAHSILGCDDVEAKQSKFGFINTYHDGGLEIEGSCFIGSRVTIERGVYGKTTLIGFNTFIANNTLISHNVKVGKNCMILGAHICGSVDIGCNVKINPKALISNGLKIGDNVIVLLGSVVISNVPSNKTVSGHYAIEHPRYLYKFVKLFGKI